MKAVTRSPSGPRLHPPCCEMTSRPESGSSTATAWIGPTAARLSGGVGLRDMPGHFPYRSHGKAGNYTTVSQFLDGGHPAKLRKAASPPGPSHLIDADGLLGGAEWYLAQICCGARVAHRIGGSVLVRTPSSVTPGASSTRRRPWSVMSRTQRSVMMRWTTPRP